MGFFGSLGNIISGKPVFSAGGTQPPAPLAAGPKTIPVVRIGRVENHPSGQRLDIYADIANESAEAIFLDSIALLGQTHQLDMQLRAGESRQLLVYSGPLLQRQPGGYAQVRYRKQADGDYFANQHEIRCRQEGAAGWQVTEFLLRGPVQDLR